MADQDRAGSGPGSAAAQATKTPATKPSDELLCTICGLTACGRSPAEPEVTAATDSPTRLPE